MEVFRIHGRRHDPLDGLGAARIGGRWNPIGVPIVYAARAYEGALLEQLVHAGIGRLPRRDRVASRIVIPEDADVPRLDVREHSDWRDEARSRGIGEAWAVTGRSLALLVPSFLAPPWGWNVLINPRHGDFCRTEVAEVVEVTWAPRLA